MPKKFLLSGLIAFPFSHTFYSTNEVLAQGEPGPGIGRGMYGCTYSMSWFGHIAMMILWIGILVGIIFLVRWFFVSRQSQKEIPGSNDLAIDILKKRYAKGEINKEEFEAKEKDLKA